MTPRSRMLAVGVVAPLAIAVAGLVVMVVTLPRVPLPLAVHWGPDGTPDRFGGPVQGFLLVGILSLAWAVFAFVMARPVAGREYPTFNQRLVLAIGPFLVTLITVLIAGSFVMQAGLADARSGPSLTPVLVAAVVAALAAGALAWLILPAHAARRDDTAGDPETLDLAAGARAVWTRTLHVSRVMAVVLLGVLVVVLLGGGLVMWFVAPTWAFVLWVALYALVIVGVIGTLSWRVTVDGDGFVARSVYGYPRFVVPLDRVQEARVVTADALREFGGFGVRWAGRGRWGVITRSGEALQVTRVDGSSVTVTVPQAATGAALLNSLARRA